MISARNTPNFVGSVMQWLILVYMGEFSKIIPFIESQPKMIDWQIK